MGPLLREFGRLTIAQRDCLTAEPWASKAARQISLYVLLEMRTAVPLLFRNGASNRACLPVFFFNIREAKVAPVSMPTLPLHDAARCAGNLDTERIA